MRAAFLHRQAPAPVLHTLRRPPARAPTRAYGTGMTPTAMRTRQRSAVDSVGTYLHEIGRVPLLTPTDEITLARRIEVGLLAGERMARLGRLPRPAPISAGDPDLTTGDPGPTAGDPDLTAGDPGPTDDADLADAAAGPTAAAALGDELRWLTADGMRAMDHLICANLRLVVSVARHFTGRGLDLLDLIQEGNLGLIRAAERFDHTRGFKFSTYATWWIRQTIHRALADQARTIRVPAHQAEAIDNLTQVQHRVRVRFGRDGTAAELSEASGLSRQQVLTLVNHTCRPQSIDAPVWADFGNGLETVPFGDTIVDVRAPDPCEAAGRTLLLDRLACHLALLPDREASVLRMRFGLGGEAPKPRREIGAQLGVSGDRVRQIELQALARLRPPLASELELGEDVRASA